MNIETTRMQLQECAERVLTRAGKLERPWLDVQCRHDGAVSQVEGAERFTLIFRVPERVAGGAFAEERVQELRAVAQDKSGINVHDHRIEEPDDEKMLRVSLPVTVLGDLE